MIKEKTKLSIVTSKFYYCNNCGKSLLGGDGTMLENYGLIAEVRGGYCSPALDDNTRYEFCICENCLVKLFDTFKYYPSINGEENV